MPAPSFRNHRAHMRRIRLAALAAADAGALVGRSLRIEGGQLRVDGQSIRLDRRGRVYIVAFGKASVAMAAAAARILGRRMADGIVAHLPVGADDRKRLARLRRLGLRTVPAGHPLPDAGSLRAGRTAAALLSTLDPQDLVLALISGGGSAMMELPLPGVGIDALQRLNRRLLRSGLPIEEINVVRRALSKIKGGGLVRLAAPARVVGLILSDVPGAHPQAVASGPTFPVRDREARIRLLRAKRKLHRAGLWPSLPHPLRRALSGRPSAADSGNEPPGGPRRPVNVVLATNSLVTAAAGSAAAQIGFTPLVVRSRLRGEARHVGRRVAQRLRRARRPACLVLGGETTVTVRGRGRGGRNQELALAAADVLDGQAGVALMALATDGVDGPTDAAGALINGDTLRRIRARGVDPADALATNSSYDALKAADALIRTGPTGTNLNDIVVALAYER